MRYARSLGIPTTSAEFAATIKTATPTENAAPFYRQLSKSLGDEKGLKSAAELVTFDPNPTHKEAAKKILSDHAKDLNLTDRAAAKPRCWFNRDWNQGSLVLFRELQPIRGAASLIAIRASLSAASGNSSAALADIQKLNHIAAHVDEEPIGISHLVSRSIRLQGIRLIADWAFQYRDHEEYRTAYKIELSHYPLINEKRMYIDSLYTLLLLIKDSSTEEGLKKFFIDPRDVPKIRSTLPIFLSQPKSKIEIVAARIKEWQSWDLPPSERNAKIEESEARINAALLAFPMASTLYRELDQNPVVDADGKILARAQIDTALARALCGPNIPTSIKISDILSPFDGQPITYHYNGHQLEIRISGKPDPKTPPITVKFPPDFKKN